MLQLRDFSKIGIGTWGIGGFAERDPKNNDKRQIASLEYMLQKGLNFFEVNKWYAEGHCAQLVASAVKKSKVPRAELFITQAIYDYHHDDFAGTTAEFPELLDLFETDYFDAVEFNPSAIYKFGFDRVSDFLQELLADKKVRYVGLMNAGMKLLKKFHEVFKDKFIWFEVGYNFEVRENERMGMMPYAKENGILNIVYQPLRRNRTALHNWPLLVELSEKYGRTQNQIIINWLVSKGYRPLTKSQTISHIDEHLDALEFEIDKEDLINMDEFVPPGYKSPKIDWEWKGDGVPVAHLSNVFDDILSGKFENN